MIKNIKLFIKYFLIRFSDLVCMGVALYILITPGLVREIADNFINWMHKELYFIPSENMRYTVICVLLFLFAASVTYKIGLKWEEQEKEAKEIK